MDRNHQNFELAKYRVKVSHFTEQGFDITGIVQAGVNIGQEYPWYVKLGISNYVGFEPLPTVYNEFRAEYPLANCYNLALGNTNEIRDFHIIGDGYRQQSSFLIPTEEAHILETIPVTIARLDTLIESDVIGIIEYDCLVIDVQGFEYEVLDGCGDYLYNFKYISVECSEVPHYDGEKPAEEVVDFLVNKGFTLDSPVFSHDDVFFVRNDVKPVSDQIYRGLS